MEQKYLVRIKSDVREAEFDVTRRERSVYERKTEITPLPEGKPEQWTWGSNGCTHL